MGTLGHDSLIFPVIAVAARAIRAMFPHLEMTLQPACMLIKHPARRKSSTPRIEITALGGNVQLFNKRSMQHGLKMSSTR